jgi:2-polyprenyl-6-methoxyphenol hydroxylase-like FAD-dependent oxidoreductase
MRDHDVIIVGAGPAGTAMALFAAREGLRVLLLDRCRFPRDKICGDAVLPMGVAVLRELCLLGLLAAKHVAAVCASGDAGVERLGAHEDSVWKVLGPTFAAAGIGLAGPAWT